MPARRKQFPPRTPKQAPEGVSSLTPESLVRRWDGAVTLGTLKNWRSLGRGPPWTKLERQVVYPLKQLIEWESRNTNGGDGL
jgi:hypothetical protein